MPKVDSLAGEVKANFTPLGEGYLRRGNWLRHGHKSKFGAVGYPQQFTPLGAGLQDLVADYINNNGASEARDVYQFGVYTGTGLAKLSRLLSPFGTLFGFDSFQGIPEELDERERDRNEKQNKHFRVGGYSAADAMNEWNVTKLMAGVLTRVGALLGKSGVASNRVVARVARTILIPGYFNESLTPSLLRTYRFQPALLVDVDVDIYSSTKQCLDWMFAVRFDRAAQILWNTGHAH